MNISKCTHPNFNTPLFFVTESLEVLVSKGKKIEQGKSLKDVLGLTVVSTTSKTCAYESRTLKEKMYLASCVSAMNSVKRSKVLSGGYNAYFDISDVELASAKQLQKARDADDRWVEQELKRLNHIPDVKASEVYIQALAR